jgi:hypothetical protein
VGVIEKELDNPIYLEWKLEINKISVSPLEHETKKVDEDYPMNKVKKLLNKQVELEKNANNYIVDESEKELDKRNKGDYLLNEVVDTGNLADNGTFVDTNMDISSKPKRMRSSNH